MSASPQCLTCIRSCLRSFPRPQLTQHSPQHSPSQLRLLSSSIAASLPAPLPYPSPKKTVSSTPQPAAYKPRRASASSPTSALSRPPPSDPTLYAASELRNLAPAFTETYVAYGVTEVLLKECARQAAYTIHTLHTTNAEVPKTPSGEDIGIGKGWWYETLKLQPTFSSWAQVTFLHMYILTVRLRTFPAQYAPQWHQHLIDHFSYAAEERMVKEHSIVSRMTRNKYLKDLFMQWKGVQMAYDEGLMKGDAVLATAVWRNLFRGDAEVDLKGLAQVVAFIRKGIMELGELADDAVARGEVGFGDPGELEQVVDERSRGMDKPFAEAEEREGQVEKKLEVKGVEDGEAIRQAMGVKEPFNA